MALSAFRPASKGPGRAAGLDPGAGLRAPAPQLTFPVRGARCPPSCRAVTPGFPKARARGAGLRPRWASGVRPVASGFGGIFP